MTPLHLLIADDDPMIHLIVSQSLAGAGWQVHQALDGVQAIEAASTARFDAIILDIRMPGLDGIQVARAFRANPQNAHVPIILMSADRDDAIRMNGFFAGADDFIPKPFRTRELVERLASLRRQSGLQTSRPPRLSDDDAALWADLDLQGRVRETSPLLAATLHLPSSCRGLHLPTYLDALYALEPSDVAEDLTRPLPNGFRRVLCHRHDAGGRPTAFEVLAEPHIDGCRVSFEDITESVALARSLTRHHRAS